MYKTISKLGDGVFGSVVKAIDERTQEIVAIKTYRENVRDESKVKEIQILKKLDHPNIIKIREVLIQNRTLSIVLEYSERNLLQYYTPLKDKNRKFCEEQIQSVTYQLASGLTYLHENGFLHRDLKPENIMIKDNGIIKLIDFGQVTYQSEFQTHTDYVSTRWYRAPEQLKYQKYNQEIDIWAFGCILAELYLFHPLLPGNSEIDQLNQIEKLDIEQYAMVIPAQPLALIKGMLKIDPKERLTGKQILENQWLQHQNKFLPKDLQNKQDAQIYLLSPSQTPVKNVKNNEPNIFFKNEELECAYVPSNLGSTLKKRQQRVDQTKHCQTNTQVNQNNYYIANNEILNNAPDLSITGTRSKNYFSKPLLFAQKKPQYSSRIQENENHNNSNQE